VIAETIDDADVPDVDGLSDHKAILGTIRRKEEN